MYYTYILQSKKTGGLYKGHAANVSKRVKEHNMGKTKSTKFGIPWRLIYEEEFESRAAAIKRERYFKTAVGRRWIKANILGD